MSMQIENNAVGLGVNGCNNVIYIRDIRHLKSVALMRSVEACDRFLRERYGEHQLSMGKAATKLIKELGHGNVISQVW